MKIKNTLVMMVLVLVAALALPMCFTIAFSSSNHSGDELDESVESKVTFTPLCYVYYGNNDSDIVYGQLWVDELTKIVYITRSNESGTTGYLAPNGMAYRYMEENGTLVPVPAYDGQEIPDEWIIALDEIYGLRIT